MASPQVEDGYIVIAYELWEALTKYRIPGEQMQCLFFILRKTYGWKKKVDAIALSQFMEGTGIKKPHILRALNGLLSKKVIAVAKKGNGEPHIYGINKDFSQWKMLPKKVTLPKKVKSVARKGNNPLPKKVPTKESIKEKKEKNNIYSQNFQIFWEKYPNKVGKKSAFKEFEKVKSLKDLMPKILSAIEAQKADKISKKVNGEFAPEFQDPERWIKNERWNDEIHVSLGEDPRVDPRTVCRNCKKVSVSIISGHCPECSKIEQNKEG